MRRRYNLICENVVYKITYEKDVRKIMLNDFALFRAGLMVRELKSRIDWLKGKSQSDKSRTYVMMRAGVD